MQQSTFKKLPLVILAATLSMTLVAGCSGKQTKSNEDIPPATVPEATNADTNEATGDSDSGKAMGLQTIHFAYDSSNLDSAGKAALKSNADIMKNNAKLHVQIEGHCDQRGGIQYNIALGEKRAKGVKKFLEDLGIEGARVETISFGKERPLDPGTSEEAYSKNRRANFVITTK